MESQKKLNELFIRSKLLTENKKKIILKIKGLNEEIKSAINKKKEISEIVKKNKGERSKLIEQIKQRITLIKSIPRSKKIENPSRIKNIIKKIDWAIQTEVMPYEKEKELTKKIKELTKELKEAEKMVQNLKKRAKIEKEIKNLEQEKRIFHSMVIASSNQWRVLQSKIDEFKKSKKTLSKDIDKINAEITSINKEIHNVKNSLNKEKAKKDETNAKEKNIQNERMKHKIRKKLNEIIEKFKKKKKLTKDDLMVLQASDEEIDL